MQTRTIPSEQWQPYFDQFSRDHLGWPVTIEVLAGPDGPQKAASNLALQGISFDTKGTRPSSIEISAGGGTSPHVAHIIELPLHIREAQDPNGNVDLQIEPARGAVTLVHLRAPMH